MRCICFACLFLINNIIAQQPQDVVINEILFNPLPGGTDYIEIHNRSKAIVDLKNMQVAGRNSNGQVTNAIKISAQERLLLPGAYCLLTADSISTAHDYTLLDPAAVIELSRLPTMPDDNGEILLINAQANILDELHYDEDWHFKLLNNKEGISLERINVNDSSQSPLNWHSASATSGHGTPGYRNSQIYMQEIVSSSFTIDPPIFSPDNDGLDDYVTIAYKFPQAGYVVSITIFNASGSAVKFLARNALCGINGFFRWDGLDEYVNRLSRGIYILLIDSFNLQGKQSRLKKTITLVRNY